MVLWKHCKTNTLGWKALYPSKVNFYCLPARWTTFYLFWRQKEQFAVYSLRVRRGTGNPGITGLEGPRVILSAVPQPILDSPLMPASRNKHTRPEQAEVGGAYHLRRQPIPHSDNWCLESADWGQAEIRSPAPSVIPVLSLVMSQSKPSYLPPQDNLSDTYSCIVPLTVCFSNSNIPCGFRPFLIPQAFEAGHHTGCFITKGSGLSMSPLKDGA